MFRLHGHYYKAHRVAYHLGKGPIELKAPSDGYAKTYVLHTCDNPSCCNPDHLYLGDIWKNMQDKVERNRQIRMPGDKNPAAVLTNEDAIRIREALLFGAKRQDLANAYGVAYSVVKAIHRGKTYRVSGV